MIHLIESINLLFLGMGFVGIVLVCAVFYYALCPDNGIADGQSTTASFGNALYFSIITISTLGYGDYHPLGWSKCIATIEVLSGLILMGIAIAKITSAILSYHVRQLFASDARNRLTDHLIKIENVGKKFSELSPLISKTFAETPEKSTVDTHLNKTVSEFRDNVDNFRTIAIGIRNYIIDEVNQGDFLSEAPIESLIKTATAIDQALYVFGQTIISLTIGARLTLLTSENRKRISEIFESFKDINRSVQKTTSRDSQIKRIFAAVEISCVKIQDSYFSTPEIAVDQPNQAIPVPTQPQG